jgi:hypothetical protein
MNYFGSYRRLLGNSTSAMVAAMEIYNKPRFEYRDEVFVQLVINAWELLLKAMVSKSRRSIYYKKRRGEPYRTVSWSDAFNRARASWPADVPAQAVIRNLELLALYRDNAVHFYNANGFGVIVYSLAQTSITNYRDMLQEVFGRDFSEEITWSLMPLGVRAPIGPLEYLSGARSGGVPHNTAVEEFLTAIRAAAADLEAEGVDTGRLLTAFNVSLQSMKKIEQADIVVGVDGDAKESVLVNRVLDPNRSHPYRRKEALERIQAQEGPGFNARSFDAVVWRYGLREKQHLCWTDDNYAGLVKWSPEVVAFINRLTVGEIDEAREAYAAHQRSKPRS